MKTILFLITLSFLFFNNLSAQPAATTHHLLVSIFSGTSGYTPQIVITKEDGTQEIRKAVNKKSWLYGNDLEHRRIAPNEDSLMMTLKPFFDAGWNLTASNASGLGVSEVYVTRYFFTKKD